MLGNLIFDAEALALNVKDMCVKDILDVKLLCSGRERIGAERICSVDRISGALINRVSRFVSANRRTLLHSSGSKQWLVMSVIDYTIRLTHY